MKNRKIKDRCEKRYFEKCEGVCKTYDKIQSKYAELLQGKEYKEFYRRRGR